MPTAAPMLATSRLSVSICRISRIAGGAERRADRQLLGAQRRARELHVHHVDARDQQHADAERRASCSSVPRSGRGVKVSISGCTWPVLNCLLVSGYAAAKRLASAVNSALA